MKRLKSVLILCVLVFVEAWATDYYVSTEGSDSNYGTSTGSAFATVTKAISKAVAGDVIYMLEGTYSYTSKISLSRSGTAAKPITLQAYGSDQPVINFSGMSFSSSNRGLSLSGDYWIIKGLKEQEAGDNGMFISGSNNTIENCVFFKNRDTGLQLGNGAANNRIINCDSYGNADPTDYGDADGFACKMDVGNNNYFYGCRAWLNVDDGWDGYLRGTDDVSTVLENCWTWSNGYFLDGTDGGASANGNGFKVGGSDDKTLMHNFTLINCLAFDNKSKGFDQNNNRGDINFYNCTSFRNKGHNYSISKVPNTGKTANVKNCISINGSESLGAFVNTSNNSWTGFTSGDNDFVSLDTTGVASPRQADGALPKIDFVQLSSTSVFIDAGIDLGYDFKGSAPDLGAFEYNGVTALDNINSNTLVAVVDSDNQQLSLYLSSMTSMHAVVEIYSISGVKALSQSIAAEVDIAQFDISSLASGLYIALLKSPNQVSSVKFIF